ncbi:MAG: hypothetical protein JW994_04390 [Candidatus Omnitrophica bacterium]|nr:hypothetical protein [Candidatus Omnitrophota bacterium]
MKWLKTALALMLLACFVFSLNCVVYARSASITTTIVITVKAPPKDNLTALDKNAEIVRQVAEAQKMAQPFIKEEAKETAKEAANNEPVSNITLSGKKIYTVTDKL